MANKELSYLQVPLPKGQGSYKITKINWSGLNRRETMDTGVLSDAGNISTDAAPYLVPSQKHTAINEAPYYYDNPISMTGFDDFLLVVYKDETSVKINYIKSDNVYTGTIFTQVNKAGTEATEGGITTVNYTIVSEDSHKHLVFNTDYNIIIALPLLSSKIRFSIENKGEGYITFETQGNDKILSSDGEVDSFTYYNDNNKVDVECGDNWYIVNTGMTTEDYISQPRSIVKFNVYSDTTDPVGGNFIEKLLIFPDRKSMDFIIEDNFTPADIDGMPRMNYVTVHNSRLFGVDNDRIYASGFNDYSNWELDDAEDDGYNANHAWVSPAQANVKANGKFTGITAFAGHIICFKNDYMHELYNNKNPYRIQDIYAEGTIDNRSIAEVDGNLIFVDSDDVKLYTGGNPRGIGRPLNIDKFEKAVAGSDGRKYYLYCDDSRFIYIFDSLVGQWSKEYIGQTEIKAFASNLNGMYMLTAGGAIIKLNSGIYDGVNWWLETDIHLDKTIDIKKIRKIQLLADLDAGSTIKIYKFLNSDATRELLFEAENSGNDIVRVPTRISPKKTASYGFKLQISGTGYVKLYQLEISVYNGGELFEYGKL